MLVFLGEVVKPYFEKIPGIPCKALNLLNFVTSAIFRSCASLKFSIYDRNSRLPSLIWKAVSVKYITDVSPHHFHILYYLMLLLYFKEYTVFIWENIKTVEIRKTFFTPLVHTFPDWYQTISIKWQEIRLHHLIPLYAFINQRSFGNQFKNTKFGDMHLWQIFINNWIYATDIHILVIHKGLCSQTLFSELFSKEFLKI